MDHDDAVRPPRLRDPDPRQLPLLLSVGEVVRLLSISRATFYRLVAAGRIHTVHQGRRPYVAAEDLIAYLRGLKEEDSAHGETR